MSVRMFAAAAACSLAVAVSAVALAAQPALGQDLQSGNRATVGARTLEGFDALDFVSASHGWVVSLEANLRTTDGGRTWQRFSLPGDLRYAPQAVDFVTASVGYIVAQDLGYAGGARGAVLKSTDGGRTWKVKKRVSVDLLAGVCFVSRQRGWVVGRGGLILRTTDGGTTWKKQRSRTSQTLYAVRFVDRQRGWAVGSRGTVVRTTDGGATWSRARVRSAGGTAPDLYSCDAVGTARVWAAGVISFPDAGFIARSTNGGRTWASQGGGLGAELKPVGGIDLVDRQRGVAVGYQGMALWTADGGRTWSPASAPDATGLGIAGVKMVSSSVGYAACSNQRVLKTTDGGRSWTAVPVR